MHVTIGSTLFTSASFFWIDLLKYNSPSGQFPELGCHWGFWMYPELHKHHQNQFQSVFIIPSRQSIPVNRHPHFLPPLPSPRQSLTYFLSWIVWRHSLWILVRLFVHLMMLFLKFSMLLHKVIVHLFFFFTIVVFSCVYRWPFVHRFYYWWIFRLFPVFWLLCFSFLLLLKLVSACTWAGMEYT